MRRRGLQLRRPSVLHLCASTELAAAAAAAVGAALAAAAIALAATELAAAAAAAVGAALAAAVGAALAAIALAAAAAATLAVATVVAVLAGLLHGRDPPSVYSWYWGLRRCRPHMRGGKELHSIYLRKVVQRRDRSLDSTCQ